MAQVILHPLANCDREDAILHYSREGRALGQRFEDEAQRVIGRIERQPRTWPIFERELRRCIFDVFPYAAIYRLIDDTAYVVALAHLRRRPGYWYERLKDLPEP